MSGRDIAIIKNKFRAYGYKSHHWPLPIGMWNNEIECYLWALLNSPDGEWLEIGSFCGGSAVLMALAREVRYGVNTGKGCHCVDISFREEFRRATRAFREMETYEVPSSACGQFLPEGISFAFIDGFHSYRQVVEDFRQVAPKLCDGALVAFHDCSPGMVQSGYPSFELCDHEELMEWKEEDFKLDEAISWLRRHYTLQFVENPMLDMDETHYEETRLTGWERGKTSPVNSFACFRFTKDSRYHEQH